MFNLSSLYTHDTPARCCLFSLSIDKVTAGGVLAII